MPKFKNMARPAKTHPANADFSLEITVDQGTGFLADGHDVIYYAAATVPDEDVWRQIAEDIAGDDDLLSFTAKALSQGRSWHWDEADTKVTWSAGG